MIDFELANKALEVAKAAYDAPDFSVEKGKRKDDFRIVYDHAEHIIWVGIAGSNDRYDWVDNIFAFRGWFLGTVKAHKRWFKRTQEFSGTLDDIVREYQDYKVYVCGHSYGGAVAQNWTLLNNRVTACITFNSPKPWGKFKDGATELLMREKCYHFINEGDKVPSVPFRNRCFGREYRRDIGRFGLEHTYWNGLKKIIAWYFG